VLKTSTKTMIVVLSGKKKILGIGVRKTAEQPNSRRLTTITLGCFMVSRHLAEMTSIGRLKRI
jgi:hypothetical protein